MDRRSTIRRSAASRDAVPEGSPRSSAPPRRRAGSAPLRRARPAESVLRRTAAGPLPRARSGSARRRSSSRTPAPPSRGAVAGSRTGGGGPSPLNHLMNFRGGATARARAAEELADAGQLGGETLVRARRDHLPHLGRDPFAVHF